MEEYKCKTEPLKTIEVDTDRGIFRVNGKPVHFCTNFELLGCVTRHGPVISLTTNAESFYATKIGIEKFLEMGKSH